VGLETTANDVRGRRLALIFVTIAGFVLGLFTAFEHANALGMDYLVRGPQIERHLAILGGHGGNPWQYRVLSAWLIDGFIRGLQGLGIPKPVVLGFVASRVLIDTAMFLLAYVYYRRLGLHRSHAVLGMCLLAWAVSFSGYDSDLQFNTYLDVVFYLGAGLCILGNRPWGLIPLMILAAFNRESSGFIPLLWVFAPGFRAFWKRTGRLAVAGVAMGAYVAIFVGLRQVYGDQFMHTAHGTTPGLGMFDYNLGRIITWRKLLATFSLIPILALIGYRVWPTVLKNLFWVLVPAWFLIHAFAAAMVETRLLLVPQALVLIPGALFTLRGRATAPVA